MDYNKKNTVDSDVRMSIFNPLRVEVDMATSVIHSKTYPTHLDGLLYWSIYVFCKDHQQTISELDKTLSKSHGVYHASQALFDSSSNLTIFFAHGDLEKIQFYLNSMSNNKGQHSEIGEIKTIKISRIVEDYSWFLDDKLNRILPTSIFYDSRKEPVRSCRYLPNYKNSAATECYIPIKNTLIA